MWGGVGSQRCFDVSWKKGFGGFFLSSVLRNGTARRHACHRFSLPSFSPSKTVQSSSSSPSSFTPSKTGLPSYSLRNCSTGTRTMGSRDRDTLPELVKPTHYKLSLYDLKFSGSWSYNGIVEIDTKITGQTDEVVLNAKEIDIQDADISGPDGQPSAKSLGVTYDKESERATIKFPSVLSPSSARLVVRFTGTINTAMAGFSRAKYKATETPSEDTPKEGDFHYMLSTQFESCDARRAFPCFDEPNLKATFDFEIEVPKGLTVLSNMPVKSFRDGANPGLQFVTFDRSPVMSTYLLAWAIGDFEYVESKTKRKYNGSNIPVRVYTTRGLKNQGQLALDCATRTVDYFSEVFQIDYPLPKADLLAVHEFAMGAMENWGLVTYRTTAVLFDEGRSDARYKNRVAYVVAHELAHHWFGNLVTMDWWNELWLNEGFATWVGWLAVDHFYPEWKVWSQFVAEGVQPAFQLDSLRASHPIEVPVKNALEVDQIFDHISYLKGSSVIRMLSSYLGQETFLRGVSNYLKKNAYGNATTNDLWSALSEASGQDVHRFMDPWIRKIGFPVVTVAEEPGQISLRQTRFLSAGDVKPEEDETIWWIPLGIRSGTDATSEMTRALVAKADTIQGIDDGFYKLNKDQCGFYRTNYPPERLVKLGQSQEKLSTEDKIGLIGDAAALSVSGEGTTAGLLAFVEGFRGEDNYLVWSQISTSLANMRSIFADNDSISSALKNFTLKLATPAAEKIGWEFQQNEDFLTGQLRKLLIGMAGNAGHKEIIAEAQRRFRLWTTGDKDAIHPNLRSAIFNINISEGGRAEFEAIKHEYLTTTSVDGKEICLQSLGRTKDRVLVKEFMDFLFSRDVAIQDLHTGAASLAANSKARGLLWEYIKGNWDAIYGKMASNNIVFERFIRLSLSKFSDHGIEQDIASFFKDKDTAGYDRGLVVASDTVRTNANYRKRDEKLVLEWLQAHSYA